MARIPVGKSEDFVTGKLQTVEANGHKLVIGRVESGGVCAARNQCSHLPLPLSGGKIIGDDIVCPFHGSVYNLCDGENKDWVTGVLGIKTPKWSRGLLAFGKKPAPLTTYTVIEEDGQVFVEMG